MMTALFGCQRTRLVPHASRQTDQRPSVHPDRVVASFEREVRAVGNPIPPREARRVEEMRRIASARLRYWGLHELTDAAELVVSELVTNAIEHGEGEVIDFSISYAEQTVRIAVNDGSSNRPQKQRLEPLAEGGRGLFLVDWTAAEHGGDWGTSVDGTTTWCTLAAPMERDGGAG